MNPFYEKLVAVFESREYRAFEAAYLAECRVDVFSEFVIWYFCVSMMFQERGWDRRMAIAFLHQCIMSTDLRPELVSHFNESIYKKLINNPTLRASQANIYRQIKEK